MKYLSTLIFILFSIQAISQQDPQFSLYRYNQQQFNPATTGVNGYEFTLNGRAQWVNLDGASRTVNFTGAIPLNKINSGVGLLAIYDAIGRSQTHTIKGQYAYRVALGSGTLSVGLNAGRMTYKLDAFQEKEATDGVANDPAISSSPISSSFFDMDMGVFYKNEKMYAGLSITHLTQPNFTVFYGLRRHIYLTGGYKIGLGEVWTTEPNILLKSDLASAQIDITNYITYNNKIIIGTGWRYQDAVIVSFGFRLGIFQIMYARDFNTSRLRPYNLGSHELNLKLTFKNKSDETPLTQ